MAIMTPRGLKIRLDAEWAFSLLARLWIQDPITDAFRVLKTCEAIEDIPSVLGFACGLAAAFWPGRPVWAIGAALAFGTAVGTLLTQFGRFDLLRLSGLLWLATLWSWIAGYGFLQVPAVVLLLVAFGWPAVASWVVGILTGFVARIAIEFLFSRAYSRIVGDAITSSELNFFNAYRLHADRLGLTRQLIVSDAEVKSGLWMSCLADYAAKYPDAVARFPGLGR